MWRRLYAEITDSIKHKHFMPLIHLLSLLISSVQINDARAVLGEIDFLFCFPFFAFEYLIGREVMVSVKMLVLICSLYSILSLII